MTNILVTDSMDAIQKKLNKGGDIVFQNGTYRITKQLVLKAKSYIRLNGAVLKRCGNIQSIFLNDCSAKTKAYKGAGNITIVNGTFEGMGSYSPDNLVTFFHSHDLHIESVTFLDNRCHALELNACKNVEVVNCKFLGSNTQQMYQESIQIDSAYASGFFKSGSTKQSKCYDGTACENITIEGCLFDRSDYRGFPTACIGTHTQLLGGVQHKGINILQNRFRCDGSGCCLSLIGMKDVLVYSNYFEKCGRVARVYSKEYSYNLAGEQARPQSRDGVCENVKFYDNVECNAGVAYKCTGIYAKAVGDPHLDIIVISNEFVKSNDYEKYYLSADNCRNVVDKDNRTRLKSKIT